MLRLPAIKGVRLRLALALVLVVAGVLAVVYLIVVPSLESALVNAKVDQLAGCVARRAPGAWIRQNTATQAASSGGGGNSS